MFSLCCKSLSHFFLLCTNFQIIFIGTAESNDSDILGIVSESCRFELHTSGLPWDKAYQACKHRGLTLMSLAGQTDMSDMYSFIERAADIYQKDDLTLRSYWVGLRMESQSGETSEYQWGDCVPDSLVTDTFTKVTSYSGATGCGYMDVSSKVIDLTTCITSKTMGFICEHPAGSDSCFTTLSTTVQSLGYSSAISAAPFHCASTCLSDDNCAGIYISSESSCTTLRYESDLPSTLRGSDLHSTYIYHQKYIYHSQYRSFKPDLTEDELCNISIGSPILTTTIAEETTTEIINPTTTTAVSTTDSTVETTTDAVQTTDSTTETTTDAVQTTDSTTETTPDAVHTTDLTTETTPDAVQTTDSTTETTPGAVPTTDSTTESTPDTILTTNSPMNLYVYNLSSCVCICIETNITLEEKIANIVSKLKLETSSLSSAVRKKTCAEDPRPSAKNVGIIGILILCIFAGTILCFDAIRCTQSIGRNSKGAYL